MFNRFQDDTRWLRTISDTLAGTAERIVVEFDIKQVPTVRLDGYFIFLRAILHTWYSVCGTPCKGPVALPASLATSLSAAPRTASRESPKRKSMKRSTPSCEKRRCWGSA